MRLLNSFRSYLNTILTSPMESVYFQNKLKIRSLRKESKNTRLFRHIGASILEGIEDAVIVGIVRS
jgi:hypothetical protein